MDVQIMKSGRVVSLTIMDGGLVVEAIRCDRYMSVTDAIELASSYYGSEINVRNGVSFRDGVWYENPE